MSSKPPTKAPTSERPLAPTKEEIGPPTGLSFEERPGRPKPFLARWREPGGKKKCRSFADAKSRDTFATTWQKRREDWGKAVPLIHPRHAEVWRTFDELTGGADPLEVARFWLQHRNERGGMMTVADAIGRFLLIRANRSLARDSETHLDLHMRRLAAFMGDLKLAQVTPQRVRDWLQEMAAAKPPSWMAGLVRRAWTPMTPYTQRHHFRSAQIFFARAKAERWTDEDPTETIEPPEVVETDIHVLAITDAEALFSKNRDSLVIGRLALEAFAGLRYSSAARIHRSEILDREKGIVLPGSKHKSGRRHYVDGFPPNLWKWLSAAPAACWEVTPRQYLDLKAEAFARAGVENPGNVLRHSFCSYHVARFKDAARTAVLLTHRSPSMLYQHYKGRASEADAKRYFAIEP